MPDVPIGRFADDEDDLTRRTNREANRVQNLRLQIPVDFGLNRQFLATNYSQKSIIPCEGIRTMNTNQKTASLYSTGRACELLQVLPGELASVAAKLSIEPAVRIDGIPHFCEPDLRKIQTQLKGKKTMIDDFVTGAVLAEHFDRNEDQIHAILAVGGFMENIFAGGYPRDEATGFLSRIFAEAGESPGESPAESTVTAAATGGVYIARTTATAGTRIGG